MDLLHALLRGLDRFGRRIHLALLGCFDVIDIFEGGI